MKPEAFGEMETIAEWRLLNSGGEHQIFLSIFKFVQMGSGQGFYFSINQRLKSGCLSCLHQI